jgi:hypothetical protein
VAHRGGNIRGPAYLVRTSPQPQTSSSERELAITRADRALGWVDQSTMKSFTPVVVSDL